ncbi:MAG: hypothetical protein RR317_00590 [Bilophila sp.]
MNTVPPVRHVCDIRLGTHPAFDAWFYSFRAENNIEHHINPTGVAGPEQLRFMVALDDRQIYVPCSDATFHQLVEAYRKRTPLLPPHLLRQYVQAWKSVLAIIRRVNDREKRRNMINYCRHRFRGCLALRNILPSRLVKRLTTTLISQFEDNDPWMAERYLQNKEIITFLNAPSFLRELERIPESASRCADIKHLRAQLDLAELTRLFHLAGRSQAGLARVMDACATTRASAASEQIAASDMFSGADAFAPQVQALLGSTEEPRTFLYLCDLEGGLALDLRIIQTLLRLGHKVILTLKETPLYHAPTIWDLERDPSLVDKIPGSNILKIPASSKNDLLRRLRESRLLIISDGTGERLNLYRTSVTFARAWKESDCILAKGKRNKDVLLGTSHLFTRDIFCFWEEDGTVCMELKPHAQSVRKFSEQTLTTKAGTIIKAMRTAKDSGNSVMFYSCIIGSLPGQTKTAVRMAEIFVTFLREKLDEVFIINPAEYFEPGMDGDDLMFMWEQVQRSGLINIWRFQSMDDIEKSFALMDRKVPPIWSGKDATFSTGCTKEMRIALDMQRSHPELQIIGPSPEQFFRRSDYGVGKFFDATISSTQELP